MRPRWLLFAPFALVLTGCGSVPKPVPEPARKAEAVKPDNESRRFPTENLVQTKVVDNHLMGKTFMPGGTLAAYKKGNVEYQMFAAKLPSATDAAILLPDWNKALTDAKLVPAFGGYSGNDAGVPVFVFAKGAWIAGVAGLPEKQADLKARELAANLK